MKTKTKMRVEIRAQVDFLEVLQALPLLSRESEVWARAMERVRKLKYVHDAWIDHTCLIEISTETGDAAVAKRRIASVIEKATRILESYQ